MVTHPVTAVSRDLLNLQELTQLGLSALHTTPLDLPHHCAIPHHCHHTTPLCYTTPLSPRHTTVTNTKVCPLTNDTRVDYFCVCPQKRTLISAPLVNYTSITAKTRVTLTACYESLNSRNPSTDLRVNGTALHLLLDREVFNPWLTFVTIVG